MKTSAAILALAFGLLAAASLPGADEPQETVLDAREEPAGGARSDVDPRHPETERIPERDERDRVEEDLREALPVHRLEVLAAEQGVDEVREDCERDGEPECVGGRHQTRSRTQRIR